MTTELCMREIENCQSLSITGLCFTKIWLSSDTYTEKKTYVKLTKNLI